MNRPHLNLSLKNNFKSNLQTMSAKNSLFSKQMKMKWILNASEIETVNIIIRKWLLLLHDRHCLEKKKELRVCLCLKKME